MPLLVALDEYRSALVKITVHAEIGLASPDTEQREAALQAILQQCQDTEETVEGVLVHAVEQIARILRETNW